MFLYHYFERKIGAFKSLSDLLFYFCKKMSCCKTNNISFTTAQIPELIKLYSSRPFSVP